ncbi:Fe(3+)-hydroxamate ABC transporter permease FhuB [Paraburkholderia sp. J12]|uniref:Fe(3+)-hydroxamate ABC transporter permease FhuB n=1 Tax=Paraburkholderia sp. J12 TaxID=2805432 RepID=UPI002ABDDBFD|nr:Fe(3+)-hydroxamate ABC transporter permease FhuB [Paraburkholderia sp. J12]
MTTSLRRTGGLSLHPSWTAGVLGLLAAGIGAVCLSRYVPFAQWANLLGGAHTDDLRLLMAQYVYLPRCVVSLLAGAMLGVAGVVLQQVLRNPLADPTTLGVSAGASLSLAVVSLWFPSLLVYGREAVALAGGMIALGIVMAVSWRRAFSPVGVILGGLLVTLTAGAATSVLMLFFGESLVSVFVWQTGSLYQSGWSVATHLALEAVAGLVVVALMARPMAVLELGDESARSVGMPPGGIRAAALVVAAALAGAVVSAVGVIGFVGLVGPWVARFSGARTLAQRLVWAPAISACLLWLADGCVQALGQPGAEVPTGSVTALVGAPLLLWMMRYLRDPPPVSSSRDLPASAADRRQRAEWGVGGVLVLLACVVVAAAFNRELAGWNWGAWDHVAAMLPLRAPRIGGAAAAGGLLGIAGVLMQRMTGNAMASPEVLGVSSGASLAMIVLMFALPGAASGMQMLAGALGALIATASVFAMAMRRTYSAERLILTGIAITTVLSSLVALLMASGDPRMSFLSAWMSGSTYRVQMHAAALAVGLLIAAAALLPLIARPFEILALGEPAARSVGVAVRRYRLVMLGLCALTTGAATVIVGPVSFVGLMAPHLARLLGFRHAAMQALMAACAGSVLLVVADWLGRNALFPNQVPAGLLVMFVGGPYFLLLMWKQNR